MRKNKIQLSNIEVKMLEIGINTNCNAGDTFFEICDNIKSAGFKSVMVAFLPHMADEQLAYACKLGFNIPYIHLDYTLINNLWVKGGIHDMFMEDIFAQIDVCAKYDIPIAVMHATEGNPNTRVIEPSQFGLSEFKKIVAYAKSKNVKLALENLDEGGFEHLRFLLDNVVDPSVGFCYDAGHHNLYNQAFDLLQMYGKRLLALHLHDNLADYEYGDDYSRDLHYLPFDGNLDYSSVTNKLKTMGYQNMVLVETHKVSHGAPHLYENLTNDKFLLEAKSRAEKIKSMLS